MSTKNLLLLVVLFGFGLATSSCKKDEEVDYDVPATYEFENVSYSGQTTRLDMLAALTTYLKTGNTQNTVLDAQKMKDMYSNTNNQFADADLNSSDKNVKGKTADAMKDAADNWLDALATASTSTVNASNGVAGVVFKSNGDGYLVNENGMELTQIIDKGLMGGCFYYQATSVYLGDTKMSADNETVEPGEGTAMEHNFDECFGYFGASTDYPSATSSARFWAKYTNTVNGGVDGISSDIMTAFLTGRAAISNDDLETRDAQIAIIQSNWEMVVAGTAIHYFNEAKGSTDAGVIHHTLSEAYAFIMGDRKSVV